MFKRQDMASRPGISAENVRAWDAVLGVLP